MELAKRKINLGAMGTGSSLVDPMEFSGEDGMAATSGLVGVAKCSLNAL